MTRASETNDSAPGPRAPDSVRRHDQIFSTDIATLGRFRCPPGDPSWAGPNNIGGSPLAVFPEIPVWIIPNSGERLCADPTQVMLYNADQEYGRALLSPLGDRCLTLQPHAPAVEDADPRLPFGAARTRSTREISRRRAALVAAATAGDTLAFDEIALGLLESVRRGPSSAAPLGRRSATRPARARRVEDALAYIAAHASENISLREVADAVDASPFHLAREVRARTGWSIHERRTFLRLEHGVRRVLEDDTPLARLADELGFADQAHFTNAFKRRFGVTPGRARRSGGRIFQDRAQRNG